ncbi:MAG: tetratricopeptide repeat protein [Deltaproteobacteria bacterium]|nr:tetratricopeptide repeat protein [Deltaproteobacteria bacterium]
MHLLVCLLVLAADQPPRPSVAILPPLAATGGESFIGMAIADNLNTRLLFHSRFDPKTVTSYYPMNVFGWRQALAAARGEGLDPAKPLSSKDQARLRRQLGADIVFAGSYTVAGKGVTLTWSLVGDKKHRDQTLAFEVNDFATPTEKLATEILLTLGQSTKGIESHVLPKTPLAAMKPYAEAMQILGTQSLDPRARLVLKRDELARCQALLAAATDADDSFVRAWVARGVTAAMLDDREGAETALVRSMTAAGEFDPETTLGIYYMYARQGKLGEGIKILEDATNTHLGFLHGLGYLGMAYERASRSHDALRTFAVYEARAPKNPWARVRRAEALGLTGNRDQAVIETQAVLKDFPQSVMVMAALASRQIDAGHYDGARATIDKAMKVAPDHPALLTRLSYIALEQNQPDKALELAQRAVAALGDGRGETLAGYAHLNLGHALALLGKTDEAIAALKEAKTWGVDAEPLLVLWRDPRLKEFLADARNPFPPLPPEEATKP